MTGALLLAVVVSLAQPAAVEPRAATSTADLEALWREATLWEVGSNATIVPAAREALVAGGDRTLDFLVPAKLATKDTLVTRALQVVIPGIGPSATPKLMEALRSGDADVRRNAADLLGLLKATEAAPAIAVLLEDPDTRLGALSALGALKARSEVPAIARVLTGTAPERARVAAAVALGQVADRASVEALVGVLDSDRAQVRFAAESALVSSRAVDVLRPLARDGDVPRRVRLHALSALGRIADAASAPDLRAALLDRDPLVRGFALEALGALADAADRDFVARRLASGAETDAFVRGKLDAFPR